MVPTDATHLGKLDVIDNAMQDTQSKNRALEADNHKLLENLKEIV